jgi:hypothetical protein
MLAMRDIVRCWSGAGAERGRPAASVIGEQP